MYDVAIIGCGIVGAAAAYELSKYQLKLVVLEKENDVANATTKANSAILHAGYDPAPGTLMAKLNVRGSLLAKALCQKLDVPYRQCGSLVAAFSPSEIPALHALYERGCKNGVPGLRLLSGGEVRALEPALSETVCAALHAPSAAIVSPWEFCLALAETAVRRGVRLRLNSAVTKIDKIVGGWRLETAGGTLESRYIINAAGVHADEIHNLAAPPAFQILPDRGEYYLLDKSEGSRVSHIIFQCPTKLGKGTLVAPTIHGNLLAGPNNEPLADGDDTATTRVGLLYVAEAARKSVPDINLRESIRNFAGIRAAADTGDFVIGEANGAPGFFDLAGIKSPGLSAAPAIAELAAQLLQDAGLCLIEKTDNIDSRSRVRFKELSPEKKAALVEQNPAYGRVICRCETITEGEILDALHSPIPPMSVDAVKRRCGPGMGRCQGGFCGPRVVELLARANECDFTEILQDKAGTFLLVGETKGGAQA